MGYIASKFSQFPMTQKEAVPLSRFPASSIHFTGKSSLFGFLPRHQPFPRPRHLLPRKCRPDLLFSVPPLHRLSPDHRSPAHPLLALLPLRFLPVRRTLHRKHHSFRRKPRIPDRFLLFPVFLPAFLQFCDVGQGFLDLREEHLVFIILVVTVLLKYSTPMDAAYSSLVLLFSVLICAFNCRISATSFAFFAASAFISQSFQSHQKMPYEHSSFKLILSFLKRNVNAVPIPADISFSAPCSA